MMSNDDLLSSDWSEESLGVPRLPNRNLKELRVFGQIDVSGHQVELYGLSNIRSGFRLGFSSRGASGEFRADGRVIACLGIMFHNDPECHIHSIVRARNRCAQLAFHHCPPWRGDARTARSKAQLRM